MPREHPHDIHPAVYETDGDALCRECAERLGWFEDLDETAIQQEIAEHDVDPGTLCVECVAFAAGIHPDAMPLPENPEERLPRTAIELNRILTQMSPESTLQGLEILAVAFTMLLDIYAAPNEGNMQGMADDPVEFRKYFCDLMMSVGRRVHPIVLDSGDISDVK